MIVAYSQEINSSNSDHQTFQLHQEQICSNQNTGGINEQKK